jgi:predicted site-specific integrase-resolvase
MGRYLTCREVAKICRRDVQTVRRWISEGYLKKYIKVKDGYLIPEEELKRILTIRIRKDVSAP